MSPTGAHLHRPRIVPATSTPPPCRLLSTRRRAAPDPPLLLPLPAWTRLDPVPAFPLPRCKSRRAPPFPDSIPPCGSSRLKPLLLPLAPTRPGACFPTLDFTAPHRKLPRSRPALSSELRPARRVLHVRGRLTPTFCSLHLRAPGACHGPPRPPCGLPHRRPPLPRGFSAASMLPHRSSTVQPASTNPVGAPCHGDALGAHLIGCTLPVSPRHPRHRAGHSRGDRALCGHRAPRSQPVGPASGPHVRPLAKTGCRAGGLPRPALLLRAKSRPTNRFFSSISFSNYLINRNGSKL
jgi:hypothetical protein